MNSIFATAFVVTITALIGLSGATRAASPAQPKNIAPPKTEEEVKAVIKLLDDNNVDVQVAAALALGKSKAKRPCPH